MSTTTDILDTTIPEPAWVLDPTYDSELNPELTHSRASAGRMVSDEGKYVSRASGVERVPYGFDGDPGLLVEAAVRTNTHRRSSHFDPEDTDWESQGASYDSDKTSILDDTEATAGLISGTHADDYWQYSEDIGPAINGEATAYMIFEEGTSDKVAFGVEERNNFSDLGFVEYVWSTDTATAAKGIEANARTLTTNGPNGNKVVEVRLRYDESSEDGAILYANIYPDRNGNSTDVIAHHFQREEAPNASSPIVTNGSATTRAADDYAIFEGGQPPWWNPNEMTFYIEIKPLANKFSFSGVLGGTTNDRLQIDGNSSFDLFLLDKSSAGSFAGINNAINSFQKNRIAMSLTNNSVIISSNGSSSSESYDGNFLSKSTLKISNEGVIARYSKIVVFPRALPESTLNQITS